MPSNPSHANNTDNTGGSQGGSLLEGIAVADAGPAAPSRRTELAPARAPRQAIDAGWSKKKKTTVGIAAGVLGLVALGAGVFLMRSLLPPPLPTSAQEAAVVMASSSFKRLDEDRKQAYVAEASRLMEGMSTDELRNLFRDEKTREGMREVMEARMNAAVIAFARGQEMEMPFGRFGPGRGGPGGDGQRRPGGERPDPATMTEEQRAEMEARQKQMQERMNQRISQSVQSGNSQMNGLRGEFFSRMFGNGGPGRGPGGGGRPGGGGGGGGGRP